MKRVIFLMLLCAFAFPQHKKHYHVKHYGKKHHKGLKRHPEKFLAFKQSVKKHVAAPVLVPKALDISALVSLPEDQGQCGACWDFSLTKALRSEYMIAGIDPGVLEFNYLLNNCGPGPQEGGCNGGDFPAAANFLNGNGPNLNQNDPYTQQDGGKCPGLPVLATAANYAMVGENGPSFQDLAQLIVQKHMVSIDVAAGSGDWMNYSSGIYDGCTGSVGDIDHMIDLVGYDCETSVDANGNCAFDASGKPINGDGYLVVENNWNETWGTQAANGHGGYMLTRMYDSKGNKCNAIATDALFFSLGQTPPSPVPPAPPVKQCTNWMCSLYCGFPWCK
jgi:C1A family cysteine protease